MMLDRYQKVYAHCLSVYGRTVDPYSTEYRGKVSLKCTPVPRDTVR
jgi:hypothetical protein